MNRRILTVIIGLLALHTASIAQADETLKFRIVTHVSSVQTLNVEDVEGHTMSVGRLDGLAFLPDGTALGASYLTFTNDYIKGNGTFHSYFNLTTDDAQRCGGRGTERAKSREKQRSFLNSRSPSSAARGNSTARRATAPRRACALRRWRSAYISMPMSFSM
jgi:hypothetical protein